MSVGSPSGEPPTLAVVIISRNEERFIASTIESVLALTSTVDRCDVILVDSCSRDRTAEIARAYPIRVIELLDCDALCAALGRVIGERLTGSRYILFVDGDTQIEGEWLRRAVAILEENPRVAGISGKLREIYYRNGVAVGGIEDCFEHGEQPRYTDQLGGNAIYRRSALAQVGSFNPYVRSYEEAELGARLQKAGYELLRIPVTLGTHHTGVRGSVSELRRRYRDNLIVGYGQTLRVSIPDGLFWRHARAMNRYLLFDAMLLLGIATAVMSLLARRPAFFVAWSMVALLGVVAFILRSRSVRKPCAQILDWSVWAVPLIVGFARSPRAPLALGIERFIARQSDGRARTVRPREAVEACGVRAE